MGKILYEIIRRSSKIFILRFLKARPKRCFSAQEIKNRIVQNTALAF